MKKRKKCHKCKTERKAFFEKLFFVIFAAFIGIMQTVAVSIILSRL